MQSVCDDVGTNCDKTVKITNLLLSTGTEIHIYYLHSDPHLKQKFHYIVSAGQQFYCKMTHRLRHLSFI